MDFVGVDRWLTNKSVLNILIIYIVWWVGSVYDTRI